MAPQRATCGALVRPPVSPKQRIQLGSHCVLGAPNTAVCYSGHGRSFSAFPPRGRGQGPLLADPPGSPRPTALRFPATLSDASKAGGPERLLRPPPKSPFSSVVRTGSVIWVESRVVRTPLSDGESDSVHLSRIGQFFCR